MLLDTDFLDFRNKVFKAVFIKDLAVEQSGFIKDIALLCKGIENFCCPVSELGCPDGINTVAYSNNFR